MKLKTAIYFTVITLLITSIISCTDNNEAEPVSTGNVEIEFENKVGNQPLVLNSQTYSNANGDDFKVSTFKYYVSNITLINDHGSPEIIPESYFLIDAADAGSKNISIKNIPSGDYSAIKFTIGVDSLRNFAGAQTGALDPAKGMFWTWNSGYIFVKFEGTSSKSAAAGNKLFFHIGGAQAPNNTIRTVSHQFSSLLRIRKDSKPEMHFIVDAATLFKGNTLINFAELNYTMGGPSSVLVANNYANSLFRLDHIHN